MNITVIILFAYVLIVVDSIYALAFKQYFETSFVTITNTVTGGTVNGTYFEMVVIITLQSPKNSTNYEQTLSFERLRLRKESGVFSIALTSPTRDASSFTAKISGNCGRQLTVLTMRYLIVLPDVFSFINIYHINQVIPHIKLTASPYVIPINISHVNTAKVSLILKGIQIQNTNKPNIDFYTDYEMISNNSVVNVKITSTFNPQTIFLNYISISVIIIDTVACQSKIGGQFEQVKVPYNGYVDINNLQTKYSTDTLFFGLRNFHIQDNQFIFYFNFTATSIKCSTQGGGLVYHHIEIDYINFALVKCLSIRNNYYYAANNSCSSTCPDGTIPDTVNNNSQLCVNCSLTNSCLVCTGDCLTCSIISANCTSCVDNFYPSNGTCLRCNNNCSTCSSAINCTACKSLYTFNNSVCFLNCSTINNCLECQPSPQNTSLLCKNCSLGYAAQSGVCLVVCGDGIIINQECDDNNTNNNDGCSSTCTMQEYFNCTNTSNSASTCWLISLQLSYLHSIKDTNKNHFQAVFQIIPRIMSFSNVSWMEIIQFLDKSIVVDSISFDSNTFQLQIEVSYNTALTPQQTITLTYINTSSLFSRMPNSSAIITFQAENNLALGYYSDDIYNMAFYLRYTCMMISGLSLIMFIAGYFGGKIIALEQIAVIQITTVSLLNCKLPGPTYQSLRWLKLGFSYNEFSKYDYSTNLPANFKGSSYYANPLLNYNLCLLLFSVPLLLAVIAKILSLAIQKDSLRYNNKYKMLICENAFYGLICCSYLIFTSFILDLSQLSQTSSQVFIGIGVGIAFIAIFLMYLYFLNQLPKYFGEFKNKFEKYNICTYFYCFICIERLITSVFVVSLSQTGISLILVMVIIGVQLAFVAIRKPYVLNDNIRPLVNLTVTQLILLLLFINRIADNSSPSSILLYFPIIIALLLMVSLGFNGYFFIKEMKQVYKECYVAVDANDLNKNSANYQTEEESIEQKHKLQFQIFEKRVLENNQLLTSIFHTKECSVEKERLSYMWDNYPILAKSKLIDGMKSRINKYKPNVDEDFQTQLPKIS